MTCSCYRCHLYWVLCPLTRLQKYSCAHPLVTNCLVFCAEQPVCSKFIRTFSINQLSAAAKAMSWERREWTKAERLWARRPNTQPKLYKATGEPRLSFDMFLWEQYWLWLLSLKQRCQQCWHRFSSEWQGGFTFNLSSRWKQMWLFQQEKSTTETQAIAFSRVK